MLEGTPIHTTSNPAFVPNTNDYVVINNKSFIVKNRVFMTNSDSLYLELKIR